MSDIPVASVDLRGFKAERFRVEIDADWSTYINGYRSGYSVATGLVLAGLIEVLDIPTHPSIVGEVTDDLRKEVVSGNTQELITSLTGSKWKYDSFKGLFSARSSPLRNNVFELGRQGHMRRWLLCLDVDSMRYGESLLQEYAHVYRHTSKLEPEEMKNVNLDDETVARLYVKDFVDIYSRRRRTAAALKNTNHSDEAAIRMWSNKFYEHVASSPSGTEYDLDTIVLKLIELGVPDYHLITLRKRVSRSLVRTGQLIYETRKIDGITRGFYVKI